MGQMRTGWARMRTGMLLLVGTLVVGGAGSIAGAGHAGAQGAPTVQAGQTSTLGTVLIGSNGRTLYAFDRDTPGVSNCNDACAQTWPPLVLDSGTPTAASGVGGTLSVIARSDGRRQVALNGAPLYFYSGDAAPGDTKGEGVGGVWHAAKPLVAAAPAPAPAAAPAGAGAAGMPRTGTGIASPDRPWRSSVGTGLLALLLLGVSGVAVRRHHRASQA
jgi:predicted lipoprotein with Yx(FWY)xxD motif